MPKQTFFNLPSEKKKLLLNAAKAEFSRVSLYDALISNIVKSAGIPRGSFYQYFHNKEDVYYFLLKEFAEANKKRFIRTLQERHGDLFDSFVEEFRWVLNTFREKENKNFFKNTFLNMNHKAENTITETFDNGETFHDQFSEMETFIDKSQLNLSNETHLVHIFKILLAVSMHNLIQSFAEDLTPEQSIKNYALEIALLKEGLSKKTIH